LPPGSCGTRIFWFARDQGKVLDSAVKRREALAVGAISLLGLAMLFGDGALRRRLSLDELLGLIVTTARVHGLRLLTSDQRIIDANLVSTVE